MIQLWNMRSLWFFLFAFVCLFTGSTLALLTELWLKSSHPHIIQINSITLTPAKNGGYVMRVHAEAKSPADTCLRFSQHALYRDHTNGIAQNPWLLRDYIPLTMGVNGVSFGTISDFTVTLFIPPDIPFGKWNYVNRSTYWCTVFPGFTKFDESVTPPYEIELG